MPRRGLWLSLAASLVQAVSAILLVTLLSVVLHLTRFEINSRSMMLEEGSYGLIIAIGAWMPVSSLRGVSGSQDRPGCRSHADLPELVTRGDRPHSDLAGSRGYAAVVLAAELRPCSGALLVLLFTLAQGLFLAGIAAALVMALGTAVTIALLALLAVLSRRAALRVAAEESAWPARVHSGLAIVSACLVIASGLLFLLATASQAPSL